VSSSNTGLVLEHVAGSALVFTRRRGFSPPVKVSKRQNGAMNWRHSRFVLGAVAALIAVMVGCASDSKPAPRSVADAPIRGSVVESGSAQLSEVESEANFYLIVPSNRFATPHNLVSARIQGAGVVMEFPPTALPTAPVRQRNLIIQEEPWQGPPPLQFFRMDLATNHTVGARIYHIDGTPAFGIEAHSPSDEAGEAGGPDHANPAFLRFEEKGIEVLIYGGEDLSALMVVAKDLLTQR
jgi:hypothetical protein